MIRNRYKKNKQTTNLYNIARWKLDNPVENWLGNKADKNKKWKKIYVLYYRLFDYEYYIKGFKFINQVIDNHNWKKVGGTQRN